MILPGGKKSILGLDIGSYAIKAVVLDEGKSGLVLKGWGLVGLPPEAIVEDDVAEREIVIEALKKLMKSYKLKAKNAATSISGYSVIIKKINLPTATREELQESIEVEAEQYIPFDISEVNVDFEILGQTEGQEEQMEVILVAAKKDVIETYIDLLEDAGLMPTILDVDVFALENAFTTNYPEVTGTVALIDIGANKMNINVIKAGVSLFTRDASMGGARITEELQEKFDLDFQTAEGVKIGGVEVPEPKAVREIVARAVENWVAESQRAFEFLETTYPDDKLEAIYLSGGSSRLEGLDQYFQSQLGVPTYRFNPFLKIGIDEKKFDPAYIEYIAPQAAICMGLALRRGEEF